MYRSGSAKESLSSARKNMHSALDYPHVVSDHLRDDWKGGAVVGPAEVAEVHLNRLWVIPKSYQPVSGG